MVEFFRKSDSGDKIACVNSIHIIKSINFLLFCSVRVRCDVDIFKLTARAQSIYREVYGVMYMINWYCCVKGRKSVQ